MKLLLPVICLFNIFFATAQLRVSSIIGSNMVLQQKKANRIWGWASANQLVTVNFKEKKYNTFCNPQGNWEIFLEPALPGQPATLSVAAGNEKIEFNNILLGEVWVCSGQSNMEWTMGMLADKYKDELTTANNENIRFAVVEKRYSNEPMQDIVLSKKWAAIKPETIGDCSAIAYWYAKKLQAELKIPVAVIVSSWGGTPAQSWTGFEGLYNFPNYTQTYIENIKPLNLHNIEQQIKSLQNKFEKKVASEDVLMKQALEPGFDDKEWKEMYLPKQWEQQGYPSLDGIVIYRIYFNLDEKDEATSATLHLPAIDDIDSTYINGKFIGSIHQWDAVRTYNLPEGILKKGENVLTIKVQDNGGGGGLNATENIFNISLKNKNIPLAGKAKFKIIAALEDLTAGKGPIEHQPSVLFNGMIAPLLPLSIAGVIWYQGESNADYNRQAKEYRELFPSLINNWRIRWGQGNFPFLFVQLSSFGPLKKEPSESSWALLREAQLKTLTLPNTAMAVSIDVGDPGNIHPQQKKEVGQRLADASLQLAYEKLKPGVSGPQYSGYQKKGDKIIIQFKYPANGLMIKGARLMQVAIAGEDKKFIWADAVIEGNKVIVSNKNIKDPIAVRYAWADSPVDANLYNSNGYPATPFRTDDWIIE